MPNVEIYRDSRLDAEDILEFGFEHVAIATGARWRRDGVARQHVAPIRRSRRRMPRLHARRHHGRPPADRARSWSIDDDHFYMGGVLAELLVAERLHASR